MAGTLVELRAGTAAVTIRALAGRATVRPLASCLGGKARYAAPILAALDVQARPERVVLCDAGPWGRVWDVLALRQLWAEVAQALRTIGAGPFQGKELFAALARECPPASDVAWTATFLALQSASARGRPVTDWSEGWHTFGYAHVSKSGRERGFAERLRPNLLADRVMRLASLPWPEVEVHRARPTEIAPIQGARVYLNPPYQGTTGFDGTFTRADVEAVGEAWRSAGAIVAISEKEPLEVAGWSHLRMEGPSKGLQSGMDLPTPAA